MPNHVTNVLTLNGANKKVEEVINALLNEKGEVDFNVGFPMPKELDGTPSPTKIVSQSEYDAFDPESQPKWMGRGITKQMSNDFIQKFGADNWYDWKLANWGTKWGGYESARIDEVTFEFQTAWSTPTKYLEKMSEKFPEVTFEVKYAGEDMGYNVGEYHLLNGEYVESNPLEGGSLEAYKLAVELQGGDDSWVVNDYLTDDIEDDEVERAINIINVGGSSFEATAILLAYTYKKAHVDFPLNLSNFLLEKAVEDEDYTYATELRDSMAEKQKELE